jgi:CRISPR-associated protein Cas1
MLNINDFKEKQILVIENTEAGANLKFRKGNLVLSKKGKTINQLSCHKILAAFILGDSTITTGVIRQASSLGVSLFFMNKNFSLFGAIEAEAAGNYLLREKQYSNKNDLLMAKEIVRNKAQNQLRLLKNAKKINNYKERKAIVSFKIEKTKDEKELLGIEGGFGREFFGAYFKELGWYRRSPRTKEDVVNLLLDMGYTCLFNYIDCLLRLYGFDVYKGFYHKFFFKRKSLTCDLVEPFRCLIDRTIIRAYNLKIIQEKDFRFKNGAYFLPWKNQRKYSLLFFEEIMKHKMEIYDFILQYYRFVMNDGEYEFPKFKIKH